MKTIELYRKLGKLVKDGHGDRVIQIMEIEDGITFAVDVHSIVAANVRDDGKRVWICVGETHPPEWSNGATPTLS